MKFSIKDFFSKCDQMHSFLGIWSHLLKKSFLENFIFCVVMLLDGVLEGYILGRTLFNVFVSDLKILLVI